MTGWYIALSLDQQHHMIRLQIIHDSNEELLLEGLKPRGAVVTVLFVGLDVTHLSTVGTFACSTRWLFNRLSWCG